MQGQGGVSLLAGVRGSVALLQQRPTLMISLGGAVVLGLVAACCGVGALIAPLFLCELLALQLAHARAMAREPGAGGEVASVVRHRGWFAACIVLLGAVVLTASVAWLVGLGLGTEIIDDAAAWPGTAWLLVPASALIALVFVLPFLYAPLFLIERAAPLPNALLESARLVQGAGALKQLGLSCAANAVQVAPLIVGSVLAHAFAGPQQGSLWALAGLPLMAVTVPLGQGMISWSFALRSPQAAKPPSRPALPPRARLAMTLWTLILIAPLLAFATLGGSLVRPSRLPPGTLPEGIEPMGVLEVGPTTTSLVVPATALTVRASHTRVRVEASDGGGAGRLPLRSRVKIDRVRIGRTRDRYAIAVEQGSLRSITYVDRAGVRQDDDLRARLSDRVDPLDLALMVLALILTAAAQLPLLAAAGRVVAAYQPSDAGSAASLERGANRLLVVGLLLAPLAGWSVWRAAHALLGLP